MGVSMSLLRYAGGKTRGIKILLSYFEGIKEVASPFFGGGSFELELAARGVKVHAYDNFSLLINFWQSVIFDPEDIADICTRYFPMEKDRFYELQKTINSYDKLERAAIFYALNRCSFSGTTLSGGMSPGHARWTESAIERLRNFRVENITVEEMDFKNSIALHSDINLFCDPPYFLRKDRNNLYGVKGNGHKGFDHHGLLEILKSRDKWLMTYNDCREVREMYASYRIVETSWKYGMNKDKKSSEIIIVSDDWILPETRKSLADYFEVT